ncbi:MAG TPA: ATP-grasp domain-containing protein [Burkholderiales bacterium]|nr:ATP-grasp domain-containing protein [Burkholderiales bacterium]
MSAECKTYLIAALTARALAQSARRGGFPVVVLDLYNDLDTHRYAQHSRAVAQHEQGFDAAALLKAADELCPPQHCAGLICGSGFEDQPQLLKQLAAGRPLYGNTAETVTRIKDPRQFFALLDELEMTHPEVRFAPPRPACGWLAKKIGGYGGTHVLPAAGRQPDGMHYYQKLESGRSMSATFLADGKKSHIIGFNEQWTTSAGSPFSYAGAISHAKLDAVLQAEIARKLDQLVQASGLAGLNGMDFLLRGNEYRVLEINPRPCATMDLYDDDCTESLFGWHLRACRGELPQAHLVTQKITRGHAVIYAERTLRIPMNMKFPEWVSDIPGADKQFAPGAPVCMVHAQGASAQQVKRLLMQRQAAIARAITEEAA